MPHIIHKVFDKIIYVLLLKQGHIFGTSLWSKTTSCLFIYGPTKYIWL